MKENPWPIIVEQGIPLKAFVRTVCSVPLNVESVPLNETGGVTVIALNSHSLGSWFDYQTDNSH